MIFGPGSAILSQSEWSGKYSTHSVKSTNCGQQLEFSLSISLSKGPNEWETSLSSEGDGMELAKNKVFPSRAKRISKNR